VTIAGLALTERQSNKSGLLWSARPVLYWPRGLTDDGILRREPLAEQSRLDVVEGRVEELSRHWDRLFGEIGRLDSKIDTLGGTLSARIDALDQKVDRRFEMVDRKMDDLRVELSRQFRWTFSTMLALLGMMLSVGAGVATALLRN
jgi:hypothetical protein